MEPKTERVGEEAVEEEEVEEEEEEEEEEEGKRTEVTIMCATRCVVCRVVIASLRVAGEVILVSARILKER